MSRKSAGVRLSLAVKFALLILAMMVLASGTLYLIVRMISYDNMMNRLEEEMFLLLSSTDWAISLLLETGDERSIQRLLENVGASPRLSNVRLYGPDGTVMAANDPAEVRRTIPEKVVQEIFSTQRLRAVWKVTHGFMVSEYSVAIPIRGKDYSKERLSDISAVLFVRPNLQNETRGIWAFINTLAYQILAATVLFILVIGFFIYSWILRPLRTLTAATSRIHQGDYGHTVEVTQRDELGSFADAFNIMLRQIESKDAELREHSNHLEARVTEANAQLLQVQKMEAVGRLAGGVAHDFNNILTAIVGSAEILLERNPAGEPRHEFAEEIRKAAVRAAALTQQLLAFSRKQIMQPQVRDLNRLIANLEKMLNRLLEEHVELQTVLEERLWRVKVDPAQMDQVLMNLVVNARDAMPEGGKVLIETHNVRIDGSYASRHPGFPAPGEFVVVAVSDTGIGMDRETMSHLFEPFFTTKEVGKGTGLGLSTVYGIVKQSGGYVSVYSELGEGTCFKIYLPRVDAEEPPERETETAQSHAGESRGESILLVEDDPAVRSLLPMVLREKGYSVLVARDGREALQVFQDSGGVDLVITDLIMPGMNGRELADMLREESSGLKVIFTSGYTSDTIVHHGMLDPEVVFLEKPIAMGTLLAKVRQLLDGPP